MARRVLSGRVRAGLVKSRQGLHGRAVHTGRLSSLYGLFFVVTFLEFAFLEKFNFPFALEEPAPPDKVRPVKKLNRFCRAEHDGDPWCFGLGCVYTAEHIHRPALPAVPGCGDFRGGSTFSGGGHYFELSDKSILWCTQYSAARFNHSDFVTPASMAQCATSLSSSGESNKKGRSFPPYRSRGLADIFLCFMCKLSTSTFFPKMRLTKCTCNATYTLLANTQ